MRTVVQRVSSASVRVRDDVVGQIDSGLLILLGVGPADGPAEVQWMASKLSGLRIFEDDEGRMNRSLLDTGGDALVVSQFTLAADTARGNRPGFSAAAPPDVGEHLYQVFAAQFSAQGVPVQTGRFGADMAGQIEAVEGEQRWGRGGPGGGRGGRGGF